MAWGQITNLRGPQGDEGPEGPEGPQGPPGEDGAGIAIAGSVDNYAALPDDLGTEDAGAAYLNSADGKLYIWDGTQFPTDGNGVEFRGPKGDQGDPGPKGDQGDPGADGADGEDGADGAPGARGSMFFHGSGAPGSVPGSVAGDLYLDTDDGALYILS